MRKSFGSLVAGIGLLSIGVLQPATPAGAQVDDPDLDTTADYQYVVDTENSEIDVTISLSVTADKPNHTTGSGVYQYYFQAYLVAIPSDVSDLTVTDDSGRELQFTLFDQAEGIDALEIEFRRNLYYRQTAHIVVSFTLAEGTSADGDQWSPNAASRVNAAYAGFIVWVHPAIETVSVSITAPAGFEDETTGLNPFQSERVGDEVRFSADDIDPGSFWTFVSLRRDAALITTDVEVNNIGFQVQSWPGDDDWKNQVTSALDEELPELINYLGLDWPVEEDISIVESYSPYLAGYGGWYDRELNQIEIGDAPDEHLILHELSHIWFNDELFYNRWITEGLAEQFAATVIESQGGEAEDPPPTSLIDSEAGPLNNWSSSNFGSDSESWFYGASWTVTNEIAEIIGQDTLAEVVRSAANNEISYLGDSGNPEIVDDETTWHLYLDLIENRGDVESDEILDLFREWVLTSRQSKQLDDRAVARAEYAQLQTDGEAWAPPFGVRSLMTDWDFDEATELMDAASSVVERRDALESAIDDFGGTLPAELETLYEAATDDMTAVESALTSAEESASLIRDTKVSVGKADGLFQRIGAIGQEFDGPVAQAVVALDDGNYELADSTTETINADLAKLQRTGLQRAGGGLAGLFIVGLGALFTLRRRKKRRAGDADTPASENTDTTDTADETDDQAGDALDEPELVPLS